MRVARRAAALAAYIVTAAAGVNAFANTSPILALSSTKLTSLRTLSPRHASHASNAFRAPAQQPLPAEPRPDDLADLCSLTTVLFVSAPGLHFSDLDLLSPTSALVHLAQGPSASVDEASPSTVVHPYVPHRAGYASPATKLVKRFVKQCGATVESDHFKNLWAGPEGKVVRVEVVEGLDEWDLVAADAREQRQSVMLKLGEPCCLFSWLCYYQHDIDAACLDTPEDVLQTHLQSLAAPYLVVIASVPTGALDSLLPSHTHARVYKRQYRGESPSGGLVEGLQELESELAEEWEMTMTATPVTVYAANTTSIFTPKENSGLLHRYVFFTPGLVFALLVSLVILIPLLVVTTQALGTTQTLSGLEHKMTGTVTVDSSK